MRRLIGACWLGLWLAVLLVGMPWALLVVFGIPLPRHPPQQPYAHEWIIAVVVLLLWLIWLLLLGLVALHVRAAWRRVRLPHPRLAAPPEGLLAGLVGAAVVAVTTTGSRGGAAVAQPPPATAAPVPPAVHPQIRSDTAAATPLQTAAESGQAPPASPPSALAHPVADGDSDPDGSAGHAGQGSAVMAAAGVSLPDGGWIGPDTATAVTAASGLLWVRRRRYYVPHRPTGSARDDPDLAELPPAVAVLDAVAAAQDATGQPARWRPTPGAATAACVGVAPAGPLRPADLPAGGVCLTGPGATDAARGLLTAVLLSGGPGHLDLDGQVLTTTADLAGLFGPGLFGAGLVAGRQLPGLHVCDSVDQLLAAAETHLLRYLRPAPHHHVDVPGDHPGRALEQPTQRPPLLLLAAVPAQPGVVRRLAVLLTHPPAVSGLAGVLLGEWPYGPTWQIGPDGTITSGHTRPGTAEPDATRLCVLSETAATDLLMLQAQARPGRHHTPLLDSITGPTPGDTISIGHHPGFIRDDPHHGLGTLTTTTTTTTVAAATAQTGDPVATGSLQLLASPPPEPDDSVAVLRLRLLGSPALYRDDDPDRPVRLDRVAAVQILVLLALHPDGMGSGELAAAIWPGVRPRPTNRLYTATSALRTTVARAAGVDVLTRDGDRYHLDRRHLKVDLWTLQHAIDRATNTTDEHTQAQALREVIGTYRGELAEGYGWSWLQPAREAVRRHVLDAHLTLAERADPADAAAMLDAAVRVDPVNEHLYRQAMRAHAAAGRPGDIVRLLRQLTEQLNALGDQPDPGTTATARRLTTRHHRQDG